LSYLPYTNSIHHSGTVYQENIFIDNLISWRYKYISNNKNPPRKFLGDLLAEFRNDDLICG
jgi:hypothetical protein